MLLQVFDWDRFSKNDPLGELKLQLGYFDLSRAVTEWRQLHNYSGKVRLVSLSAKFNLSIDSPQS